MIYRCKCGKFLCEIKSLKNMSFGRTKKTKVDGMKLTVTCRCGEDREIDLNFFKK